MKKGNWFIWAGLIVLVLYVSLSLFYNPLGSMEKGTMDSPPVGRSCPDIVNYPYSVSKTTSLASSGPCDPALVPTTTDDITDSIILKECNNFVQLINFQCPSPCVPAVGQKTPCTITSRSATGKSLLAEGSNTVYFCSITYTVTASGSYPTYCVDTSATSRPTTKPSTPASIGGEPH